MKKNFLVSIIVPVYNVQAYLEECVESLLGQTYPDLEILLVDDGSEDESPLMCDAYARKDPRIRVLHKENGGLMSAWMAGVRLAGGEYLMFVDSDDWIAPETTQELVSKASGDCREIICGNYIIEKTQKNQSVKVKQAMPPGTYEREEIETMLYPNLLGRENRWIHASRCMKLISKELILDNMQYGNPAVTMGEDLNIMFPALMDAQRIVVLEEGYFYHYRFVNASMAHKYQPDLGRKVELLYQTLRKVIEQKSRRESEKEDFLYHLKEEYVFLMFYVLKNELRGADKNTAAKIKKMVKDTKEEYDLGRIQVQVNGKANRLLYDIWKKPGNLNIAFVRWLIRIFDGKMT